jgi:GrpB-like predicted nucleotidyltransferase (UPF0157 family)
MEARRAAAAKDLAATGRPDAAVVIAAYDPGWPARFEAERRRLAGMLPGARIEHVGSTAVPGLAAKPTIDVMALVDDLDLPIPVLVERGRYEFPPEYNATLERRRWLCRPSASLRLVHLHLTDDPDLLAEHLRFRDALRGDPELAAEYEALKRSLAERFGHDREGYTAGKTGFVLRVTASGTC